MEEELKKQLEEIYQGIDGDDSSKAEPIINFIDQNFIGKEEVLKDVKKIEEALEKLLEILKR